MQFKHPEFLYFLFLLVIPILVHLFQLRKFKKELFTNVKFLKELAIQTRKSSKLKKYLLLATRLLLLTAMILAFAQPFFKAKDNKNAGNEMYIILDNSFSMQAKGKKGELLKRALQDLLEHTPENINFSILTNSDNYYNTSIKAIQQDLQNMSYSATPFQIDNILAKINARKSAFNKDIIVITDALGLKENQLKSFKKEDNVFFYMPEAEQENNVAVDSVFINQTLDNFYEIGVKIDAFGDKNKDVSVALYNQNKLIAKTLVNFENNTKTLNFAIPKENFHGYVAVSDNGLDYDNTYYFSLSKPEKSNVISVGDAEKSSFLSRIYTSDEFNYTNYTLSSLDYNAIDKQDAIVLNEISEIPQALQTTLKSFVEKGGNVIFIPSAENAVTNINSFLSSFGSIQFKSLVNAEKTMTKINFSHPLFSSVFEKKVDNFQYPTTKSSFDIASTASIILGNNDQSPFLSAFQNGLSSVFVFSAPINKSNSNFQNSPLIVPTFYNMAQNTQKTGVKSFTIGKNQSTVVETLLSKDEIVSIKNSQNNAKGNFIPVQQILNNKVKLTFNDNPTIAGNYGVFNNTNSVDNISFNYDRTESNLSNPNTNAASEFEELNDLETIFDTIQTNRTDSQIWKWFVVLTLLFLVIEILIQKLVK
ncbi:MAG: BatA and WFA domain-containing protein [Flavobacterium sp.]|nr:BatA and WFA domain-containing protein [Flavobacterium sp.]